MKNPGVGSDQQWKKAECVWYLTGSSFNAVKVRAYGCGEYWHNTSG